MPTGASSAAADTHDVDTAPAPVGIGTGPDPERPKWEAKLDGNRPLGARELYRALNDALDEGHEQFDLSNRDARLAMVVLRDTEAHWQAWRHSSLDQLNAELAVQLHSLCLKNQARKMALRGLYSSLRHMTMVFSAILLLFAVFSVF